MLLTVTTSAIAALLITAQSRTSSDRITTNTIDSYGLKIDSHNGQAIKLEFKKGCPPKELLASLLAELKAKDVPTVTVAGGTLDQQQLDLLLAYSYPGHFNINNVHVNGPLQFVLRGDGVRNCVLNVSSTSFSEPENVDFSNANGVTAVSINSSNLGDVAVRSMEDMPHLWWLDLSATPITDALLPVIADMPSLRVLVLERSSVSDEGVRSFRADRPDIDIIW